LKVTALKDGVIASQTCLVPPDTTPGGIIELSVDTVPPEMICPSDIAVECSEFGGSSASSSTLKAFLASAEQNTTDNCDPNPKVTNNAPILFPLGETPVTFTATDAAGATSDCTAVVKVLDTTPPQIGAIVAEPSVLWPPNHKMVPVKVNISASDICTAKPSCKIISVASNEPIDGLGDGNMTPDWVITGDFTVNLRAERSGIGSDRIYTITISCTDTSGNSTSRATKVTVPHDKKLK
jgi:hypothetical protein